MIVRSLLVALIPAALLLLVALHAATAFTTSSAVLTSTTRPTNTRQYAFFDKGKPKKTEKIVAEVDDNNAPTRRSSSPLNFFMPPVEPPPPSPLDTTIDLDKEEQEMAMSLADAEISLEKLLLPLGAAATLLIAATIMAATSSPAPGQSLTLADVTSQLLAFQADPQGTLQASLDGLGPLAIVYFGALYVLAELLAIPATPLTLTAGYLFGVTEGTLVVLTAGAVSAMIGFFIGKTFLRSWVETVLEENPKFKKLDTAIGAEGFKLLVLVRLSPIFPFALLNYTYGASSISFPTFVAGTLLGFTPSTLGYVYTGLVGKELLLGNGTQPWYVYAAGATLLLGFLKLVTDVATQVVEAIDEE